MNTINVDIKALIWDMGGVLLQTRDWQRRHNWESRLNLPVMGLNKLVFGGNMSHLASLGQASEDQVWQEVQQSLNLPDKMLNELRADFFIEDKMDDRLLDFIRAHKQTHKIGLISNAWPGVRELLTHNWKIADLFDDLVISAEVGIVKPDPRIYHLSLQNLQIAPQEAIFIDDFIENIHAAALIGMKTVHFQNTDQALAELKSLLYV